MAKKEVKEKIERSYNIPLRKSTRPIVKYKKTPRAIRAIRAFLQKHMKSEEIQLGMHLNEYVWKHGIKNPPHHVKVHVIKEGDVVKAELEGFEFKGAVKAEPKKEEPKTMKDKLAAKLGVDTEVKPEAKTEEKKEEPKKEEPVQEKEKTPPTADLAAKKQ
jgi:large subunit ribosomal protein L31e